LAKLTNVVSPEFSQGNLASLLPKENLQATSYWQTKTSQFSPNKNTSAESLSKMLLIICRSKPKQ